MSKILFQRLSSGGHTRSHPEHGSQAPDRRWYLVLGSGRVGRRWIHAPLMVNRRGGFFFACHPGLRAGAGLHGLHCRYGSPRRSVTHYRYVPARDCHPGPCAGTGLHDTPLQIRFPSRKRYSLQIQFLLQIRSPLRS